MSPKNSPKKLSILAKDVLLKQIVKFIKYEKHFDWTHDFLHSNLPIQYIDQIMNEILSLPIINNYNDFTLNDPDIKHFRILNLLLSPYTKTLQFDLIPLESYEIILNKIKICLNLTYLDIKSFSTENEDIINKFKDTLVNLNKLHYLCVGYIGNNDNIIKNILDSCPNLQELYIKQKFLSDSMVRKWPIHHYLRKMNLYELINAEKFTLIVERFPKLEILKNSPFTGDAVTILRKKKDENFKLEIISIRDMDTTLETLKNINIICPKLQTLDIFRPEMGIIHGLKNFKNLQHIVLDSFICEEVESLLTKCGQQFRSLKLNYGKGTLRLNNILNNCPNLIHFSSMYNQKIEINNNAKFHYPNLLELIMHHSPDVPDNFEILLFEIPSLEYLDVENWISIQDSHIWLFLEHYKIWKSLKSINLCNSPLLSINSFWMFVENCPLIEHVHEINTWNISQTEIEFLINNLKIRNYKCCVYKFCQIKQYTSL